LGGIIGMSMKDNIVGLLIIFGVFLTYHLLQPMGDGFFALEKSEYSLKKHGTEKNKHAKFTAKHHGVFYVRAGAEDDVRGTLSLKQSGALILQFEIYDGDEARVELKHNDNVVSSFLLRGKVQKTLHFEIQAKIIDMQFATFNISGPKTREIMSKVFLGGTCNNSTWRDEIIPYLTIDYFNPVVDDWTPECQKEEIRQKDIECNIHLYVITKEMTGVFSIAEAVESAMTDGKICVFRVIADGFGIQQRKSLESVCDIIRKHGGDASLDSNIRDIAKAVNEK